MAKLLLESGVGRMLLVDHDVLEWSNLGRHELGANSVGKNKALELAARFARMYPYARELRAERSGWQKFARRDEQGLRGVDLVLSLIGDWNAESALNDTQRFAAAELSAPVLYGWLEEQAGAAHALAIGPTGACLRCGFNATGTIKVAATAWPDTGPVACGAPTSVYGAVELAPAQALVAGLAIDLLLDRAAPPVRRAWLAPRSVLEHGRGHWNTPWIERHGDPGPGGTLMATAWPEDPDCSCSHH